MELSSTERNVGLCCSDQFYIMNLSRKPSHVPAANAVRSLSGPVCDKKLYPKRSLICFLSSL